MRLARRARIAELGFPAGLAHERSRLPHLKWGVFVIANAGGSRRGDYLFMEAGEISTENAAQPLPLEETVVGIALRASLSRHNRQK